MSKNDGICRLPWQDSEEGKNGWRTRLDQEISHAWKVVGTCAAIAFILIGMFIYCVIRIGISLVYYLKKKRDTTKAMNKTLTTSLPGGVNVNDSNQDDEIYEKRTAEASKKEVGDKDDYYAFQDTINKSLSEYKTLNEKLTSFFKDTRNTDAPDQYDRRIFNRGDDNW